MVYWTDRCVKNNVENTQHSVRDWAALQRKHYVSFCNKPRTSKRRTFAVLWSRVLVSALRRCEFQHCSYTVNRLFVWRFKIWTQACHMEWQLEQDNNNATHSRGGSCPAENFPNISENSTGNEKHIVGITLSSFWVQYRIWPFSKVLQMLLCKVTCCKMGITQMFAVNRVQAVIPVLFWSGTRDDL